MTGEDLGGGKGQEGQAVPADQTAEQKKEANQAGGEPQGDRSQPAQGGKGDRHPEERRRGEGGWLNTVHYAK